MWEFTDTNPCAKDIGLLVEISEPELAFLGIKLRLYARAGISDYWIADLPGRRLVVHREPQPDGSFGSVLAYRDDEPINPLAAPETEFRLADLFKEEA